MSKNLIYVEKGESFKVEVVYYDIKENQLVTLYLCTLRNPGFYDLDSCANSFIDGFEKIGFL